MRVLFDSINAIYKAMHFIYGEYGFCLNEICYHDKNKTWKIEELSKTEKLK